MIKNKVDRSPRGSKKSLSTNDIVLAMRLRQAQALRDGRCISEKHWNVYSVLRRLTFEIGFTLLISVYIYVYFFINSFNQ